MSKTDSPQITPDTVKVCDVEYVRADSIQPQIDPNSPVKIVVLQRGWVAVGRWSKTGEICSLDGAKIIRKWGTPGEGLGALTRGPKPGTVLDDAGHLEYHEMTEVFNLACDPAGWSL